MLEVCASVRTRYVRVCVLPYALRACVRAYERARALLKFLTTFNRQPAKLNAFMHVRRSPSRNAPQSDVPHSDVRSAPWYWRALTRVRVYALTDVDQPTILHVP